MLWLLRGLFLWRHVCLSGSKCQQRMEEHSWEVFVSRNSLVANWQIYSAVGVMRCVNGLDLRLHAWNCNLAWFTNAGNYLLARLLRSEKREEKLQVIKLRRVVRGYCEHSSQRFQPLSTWISLWTWITMCLPSLPPLYVVLERWFGCLLAKRLECGPILVIKWRRLWPESATKIAQCCHPSLNFRRTCLKAFSLWRRFPDNIPLVF